MLYATPLKYHIAYQDFVLLHAMRSVAHYNPRGSYRKTVEMYNLLAQEPWALAFAIQPIRSNWTALKWLEKLRRVELVTPRIKYHLTPKGYALLDRFDNDLKRYPPYLLFKELE